jgi:hypothetical protein
LLVLVLLLVLLLLVVLSLLLMLSQLGCEGEESFTGLQYRAGVSVAICS